MGMSCVFQLIEESALYGAHHKSSLFDWTLAYFFVVFSKKKKKHVYNEKINSSNDSYKQYHKYSQIKSNVKARENV